MSSSTIELELPRHRNASATYNFGADHRSDSLALIRPSVARIRVGPILAF